MKKVIFVGGTAYSGSTFFDMTLANDPKGFSCGEVYALFHPFQKKHLDIDSLSDEIDWRAIKKDGPKNLYNNIFDQLPGVDFIVDSSKTPLWIYERSKELCEAGIDVKNILIWKYPMEFKKSKVKRGEESNWKKAWINYHKYYMEMVQGWRSVKYKDFAQNEQTLQRLCEILEIDFFAGKEKFWEKKQYTLFGNISAKIHLYDRESSEYDRHQKRLEKSTSTGQESQVTEISSKHKRIYYDNLEKLSADKYMDKPRFKEVIDIIDCMDIYQNEIDPEHVLELRKAIGVGEFYKLAQVIKLKYLSRITNKF